MTAPKNPYTFTDEILVRELSRRIGRKDDDRLNLLLEVVYQRLWERSATRLELLSERLYSLEDRQAESLEVIETLNARLRRAVDLPHPRPHLTLVSQPSSQLSSSPADASGPSGRGATA